MNFQRCLACLLRKGVSIVQTFESSQVQVYVCDKQHTLPVGGVAVVLFMFALMIMSGMGWDAPQSHMRHADKVSKV